MARYQARRNTHNLVLLEALLGFVQYVIRLVET